MDGWNDSQATALLGAMKAMARPGVDGEHSTSERLVLGAAKHVFDIDTTIDALEPVEPAALAAALDTPEQRQFAVEFLVLVPYADMDTEESEVAIVDRYAAALGTDANTLHDLHNVSRNHIKRLVFDYSRRSLKNVAMPDSNSKVAMVVRSVHQYVGEARVAARYQQLETLPPGTLGREFYDFYRARQFPIPGEKHSFGEALVGHDCCHILSGFNTDGTGELNVAGFEAGMKKNDFGYELLMEVLLAFQLGVVLATGYAGFVPKRDELDPDEVMVGIHRGLGCSVDILGPDWKFWDVADHDVLELRERYSITGVSGVVIPPPEHPATSV